MARYNLRTACDAIAVGRTGQGAVTDWARVLAYVTGTVDHELLARNEYLATEECLSELILFGERSLRRVLSN